MELTPMKIVRQWAQTINWNAHAGFVYLGR